MREKAEKNYKSPKRKNEQLRKRKQSFTWLEIQINITIWNMRSTCENQNVY